MLPSHPPKSSKSILGVQHTQDPSYSTQNPDEYQTLIQELQHIVGADCNAVVLTFPDSTEVLFNSYVDQGVRDWIIDQRVRADIIENFHRTVLVQVNRRNTQAFIDIYLMSDEYLIVVRVVYEPSTKTYTVLTYRHD